VARVDHRVRFGLQRLAEGRNAIRRARGLVSGDYAAAECEARGALASLGSAMDWLEDTQYFEEAHQELDSAGRFVRQTFGCMLHQEGTRYEQRCPVALAHVRVGFSVGLVIREAECSICGRDPDGCPHITGRMYNGKQCFRVIKRWDLLDVSLVDRPAQPDARIMAMSVPTEELQDALGPEFIPGMPVSCDLCLAPCPGVKELEGS